MSLGISRHGHEILAFLPMNTPVVPDEDKDIRLIWVMVFVEKDGNYLYHFNPNRQQWEVAAGGIEPNEHPDDTARRELWEETSQIASSLTCHGLCKLRMKPDNRLEFVVLYTATIDEIQPFVANQETSKLLWWNLQDKIEGTVADLGQMFLELVRQK